MSTISAFLWANVAFAFITALITFSLVYQYLLPYKNTTPPQRSKQFYYLLGSASISLFVSCILNTLSYSQRLPSLNGGSSMHIHNLTVGGWATIQFFASISQAAPFVLLVLAFAVLLQSRWNLLANQILGTGKISKTADSKASDYPFLGWKWKESVFQIEVFMLVFTPIISNLTLTIGISTTPGIALQDGTIDITRLDGFEHVQQLINAFDALHSAFIAIAIIDIDISTFLLSRRLRSSRYVDPIVDLLLIFFGPLLLILALQTVIGSSFHTMGSASTTVLAKVDLATMLMTIIITVICIIGLSILYHCPEWWKLSVQISPDDERHEMPARSSVAFTHASTRIL